MSKVVIAVAEEALATLTSLSDELDSTRVTVVSGPTGTPEEVARLTNDADAIIVTLQRLSAAHVQALGERVRVIGRAGVGLDTIAVATATDRGVAVVYEPDYATNEVADHAVSLMLAAQRAIPQANQRLRADGWCAAPSLGAIAALHECSAGVIGAGRIGTAAAARLRPFVSRVLAHDPASPSPGDDIELVDTLDELLAECQVVSLHLPLTDDTRHLIGAKQMALMPSGSVLVNVSRGGLIDEVALVDALVTGHLAAAGLDVFETEPLPQDSPLRDAPNLVLSPHMAWYSRSAGARLARWMVHDVVSFLESGSIEHGRRTL